MKTIIRLLLVCSTGALAFAQSEASTASVCAPSRAVLITGEYLQRFGFECSGLHGELGMPGRVVTYAEAMKQTGYETMALGKWHLGSQPEMLPNAQGFDHFSGFIAGGRSYGSIKKTVHNDAA